MKAIMPKDSSLEGISNHSTPPLHAILYANINANINATPMQTK